MEEILTGAVQEMVYKKQRRNKVKNAVRRLVWKQQNKIALEIKTNPKMFWSYMLIAKLKLKIKELKICGNDGQQPDTVADQEKADAFNSFFASLFTTEWDGLFAEMTSNTPILYPMADTQILIEEIKDKLERLNVKKSSGPARYDTSTNSLQIEEETGLSIDENFKFLSSIKNQELSNDRRMPTSLQFLRKGNRVM